MTDKDKKEESTEQKKAPKEEKQVGSLKGGDFTVHIFVQKVKEIAIEDPTDVIMEINCDSQKEYTEMKEGVTSESVVNWAEHVFIELRGKSIQDVEGTKISLKLCEKSMFKNAVIGMYEFDFSYIYFMKDHTLKHAWVALSNPESEDFSQVAGFFKLSISITGEGDKPIELKDDDTEDDAKAIMPAAIKPKYKQMKLHIIRAEHLPRLDAGVAFVREAKMDAYLATKIGNKVVKTKTVTTEHDCAVFEQTMLIPIQIPIMSGTIKVGVWDEDTR